MFCLVFTFEFFAKRNTKKQTYVVGLMVTLFFNFWKLSKHLESTLGPNRTHRKSKTQNIDKVFESFEKVFKNVETVFDSLTSNVSKLEASHNFYFVVLLKTKNSKNKGKTN